MCIAPQPYRAAAIGELGVLSCAPGLHYRVSPTVFHFVHSTPCPAFRLTHSPPFFMSVPCRVWVGRSILIPSFCFIGPVRLSVACLMPFWFLVIQYFLNPKERSARRFLVLWRQSQSCSWQQCWPRTDRDTHRDSNRSFSVLICVKLLLFSVLMPVFPPQQAIGVVLIMCDIAFHKLLL